MCLTVEIGWAVRLALTRPATLVSASARSESKVTETFYTRGVIVRNFVYQRPTKLIFGKGTVKQVGENAVRFGRRILLVTGGSSLKRLGYYDKIVESLQEAGLEIFELAGIKPNPNIDKVREGIQICRENQIDLVLGAGGGSVIDSAKVIALGFYSNEDPWQLFITDDMPAQALPVGAVLTLAATGTEMNENAVISNEETEQKYALASPHMIPQFSILDPQLTYSVPEHHTVNGIVDIAAHVYEQYFDQVPNTPLQDQMAEGVLRTLIEESPKVLADPENYEARANIMLSSTIALNGILALGKDEDWASHQIQHELSAIYDISHGGGLAIIVPNWMKYVYKENVAKFAQYALRVFDVDPADKTAEEIALEGIRQTREWFNSLGAPAGLGDYGIGEEYLEVMAEKATQNGPLGMLKKLYKQDVLEIYRMCL